MHKIIKAIMVIILSIIAFSGCTWSSSFHSSDNDKINKERIKIMDTIGTLLRNKHEIDYANLTNLEQLLKYMTLEFATVFKKQIPEYKETYKKDKHIENVLSSRTSELVLETETTASAKSYIGTVGSIKDEEFIHLTIYISKAKKLNGKWLVDEINLEEVIEVESIEEMKEKMWEKPPS